MPKIEIQPNSGPDWDSVEINWIEICGPGDSAAVAVAGVLVVAIVVAFIVAMPKNVFPTFFSYMLCFSTYENAQYASEREFYCNSVY